MWVVAAMWNRKKRSKAESFQHTNIYEHVQPQLLFHFFVFMDVISWGTMPGWEEAASWIGRVCLTTMKTAFCFAFIQVLSNVDLWLLAEKQRELLPGLILSIFLFTPCKALCLAHQRHVAVFLCASVLSFPHLPAQISEAELALTLCLLQGISAQVDDGFCPLLQHQVESLQ